MTLRYTEHSPALRMNGRGSDLISKSALFICVTIFVTPVLYGSELSYSCAIKDAQHGKWEEAQKKLSLMVVNEPDRADILYDMGVASFELKDFEKARAYFQRVTELEDVPEQLKQQAQFNLGNTYVELKKLHEAIEQYEAVLAQKPDDERAKHNL